MADTIQLLAAQYFQLVDPPLLSIPPGNVLVRPHIQTALYERMFDEALTPLPPATYRTRVLKLIITRIEKLSDLYKSNKDQVSVFGFRTQYGGGKSTGFALVYDSSEALKKFEPHYRLVRIGAADKIEKASRQQRMSLPHWMMMLRRWFLTPLQASSARTARRSSGVSPRSRVPRRTSPKRLVFLGSAWISEGWFWKQKKKATNMDAECPLVEAPLFCSPDSSGELDDPVEKASVLFFYVA